MRGVWQSHPIQSHQRRQSLLYCVQTEDGERFMTQSKIEIITKGAEIYFKINDEPLKCCACQSELVFDSMEIYDDPPSHPVFVTIDGKKVSCSLRIFYVCKGKAQHLIQVFSTTEGCLIEEYTHERELELMYNLQHPKGEHK